MDRDNADIIGHVWTRKPRLLVTLVTIPELNPKVHEWPSPAQIVRLPEGPAWMLRSKLDCLISAHHHCEGDGYIVERFTFKKGGQTRQMATSKEKLVKALVYVRQKWVDETGSGEIFASANVNPDRVNLVISATHFDISDRNFVEIVFWPRALADQPVKSVKAFIPKQEITLIVELKSPDALPALGYKTKAD